MKFKCHLYFNPLIIRHHHHHPQPYLPSSILWRQKEQFSDGVGYSWIDGCGPPRYTSNAHRRLPWWVPSALRLKDHAERSIPDEIFEKRFERWPEDTPDTKEAYHIRDLFDGEIV